MKKVGWHVEACLEGFVEKKTSIPFDLVDETAGKESKRTVRWIKREKIVPETMGKRIKLGIGRNRGVK